MKRLLNLGVSNPLTLGMAHPIADRIETLGRARPTTWRSRCLALSAMSVIALSTAPLSIAADEPEKSVEIKILTKGQSYEIVDKDGQVMDLSNLNLEGLEGLAILKGLEGLEGLHALKALEGLEGLQGLEGLEGLASLKALGNIEGVDFSGDNIQIFTMDGTDLNFSDDSKLLDKFPEKIRDMIASKGEAKQIRIIRNNGDENVDVIGFDDTVVDARFEFFQSSDPLETAQRQLERTKRQLETLSDNENLSFDLKNALRDIESAQKSIEEAESRLLDETE